ncbi:putative pyrophosphatase/phosphodiesterase [Diplonema papillatum]|nr:putative pyrophosphatase/phosphodiesterase [Diplonema papillatum]|eukprot:gene3033-4765_t
MSKATLACLLSVYCSVASGARAPLVIVSMDGLMWESWAKGTGAALENFAAMREAGVWAGAGMFPSFATKTFPNHHSIATGLYQESHGITGNSIYDPVLDEHFNMASHAGTTQWFKGEPLWVTAQKHGLKTAAVFWPGTEAIIDGMQPTYYLKYDEKVSYPDRVAQAREWLWLPEDQRPRVILLYFSQPDLAQHIYGPYTPQAEQNMRDIDAALGLIRSMLKDYEAEFKQPGNLVVVSDHGHAAVTPDRRVFLDEFIPIITDGTQVIVAEHNPYLNMFLRKGAPTSVDDVMRGIAAGLEGDSDNARRARQHVAFYRRDEIPERYHVKNTVRTGDVVAIADAGWSLTATEAETPYCCGNHGYDNLHPSMRAVFAAEGPAFRRNVTLAAPFENVNLYSLFCRLLAVPAAPSNGTLRAPLRDALAADPLAARWVTQRSYLPSRSDITVYPPTGEAMASGLLFDLAFFVPADLPGAEPGVTAVSPASALRALCPNSFAEPRVSTKNGLVQFVYGSCQLPPPSADGPAVFEFSVISGTRSRPVEYRQVGLKGRAENDAEAQSGDPRARNVVLIIGDGMSLPMLTATRLLRGRERLRLPTDDFPVAGTVFTHSLESIVTDSAASASALNTGRKTVNGASGVYPDADPEICDNNPRVETYAEYMKRSLGMRVGVVTTASLADATPAGVWAHCSDRDESDIIIRQALALAPDVLLGGGADLFNESADLRDLFAAAGYTTLRTKDELHGAAGAPQKPGEKYLGTFADHHLAVFKDRAADPANREPGLKEMALFALKKLAASRDGRFYLVVEAASVDKMAHANDFTRMLGDALELQATIAALDAKLKELGLADETLVVVTSDHSTGGFDVYGTVDTDVADHNQAIHMYGEAMWPDWEADEEYVVDNWATAKNTFAAVNNNHPSYREDFKSKEMPSDWVRRDDLKATLRGIELADNLGRTEHQEASTSSVHTAADVMVYAKGPHCHRFNGGQENTNIFLHMLAAAHGGLVSDVALASPPAALCPEDSGATDQFRTVQIIALATYLLVLHVVIVAMWIMYKRQKSVYGGRARITELDEVHGGEHIGS